MKTADIIALAETAVYTNRANAVSARICIVDARHLFSRGDLQAARDRALKSLAYSVGVFSVLYKSANS